MRHMLRIWGVLSLLALSMVPAAGAADAFVLIRNAKNPTTAVSKAELKEMVVGQKKVWGKGAAVQVVLAPPGSAALGWLASSQLGVEEGTLMSKIKQEVFKGEMKKPITAASDKDCLAAVAGDPGGVGVVSAEAAKSLPADVAILSVN